MSKKFEDGPSEEGRQPSSESRAPHDSHEFDALWGEVAELVQQERREASDKIRMAIGLRADVLTDVSAAPRLSRRHNAHVRADTIADSMCRATFGRTTQERSDAKKHIRWERKKAESDGIFVYPYPDAFLEHRLTARYPDGLPEYLIMEASASHPTEGHPRYGKFGPAADVQFHLPSTDRTVEPVFTAPDVSPDKDHLIDAQMLTLMLERPHAVAQVDDIVTDPDMSRLKVASVALEGGLEQIVKNINPLRGSSNHIEFVTAEIICITGMETEDGLTLYFNEEIEGTPLWNGRSLHVFGKFDSPYAAHFKTAWVLRNRRIPVSGNGIVRNLIADWHVQAARLKKPS